MENIFRVLKWPTSVSLGQLDMLALEALRRPELLKSITVIRQDFACEGLWMVTRDPELTNAFLQVAGLKAPLSSLMEPEIIERVERGSAAA